MRRHPTDLVGLIFGAAFAIAGVAFLVNEVTATSVNPAWATGLGLMLLGALALIATVARNIRHRDDEPLAREHERDYAYQYGYGAAVREYVPAYATAEPATAEPETVAAPAASDATAADGTTSED